MTDEDKPERRRVNMQQLQKRYSVRFNYTRQARDKFNKGDLVGAIQHYNEYLRILADVHEVEVFDLSPKLFNPTKDKGEMLLVSQVFWELTKIYDMTPKLSSEFQTCLDLYVKFTINQPYQILNAENLRKFLKKSNSHRKVAYQAAYDKVFIESKKCYIATHCFSNDALETNVLREFKNKLILRSEGTIFVSTYYKYSPKFIRLLEKNIILDRFLGQLILRPSLKVLAHFIKEYII
jgi:hypothetical protein